MSNLAGVQIHRLVLRGDTRNKTTLLASLDMQCWPGEDDSRIIFIKRLQVTSPWWMLARELAQECEAEYRAAISVETAGDGSNAIIFASEAHLISQLLINLLRNQSPWYQQTWLAQAGVAPEPVAVLLHRIALVPEILQQLHQQRWLGQFFEHCTEMDFHRLVEQVHIFLSINPASFVCAFESGEDSLWADDKQNTLPDSQMAWIQRWLPSVVQVRNVPAQQLALQLLACLGLWQFSPQHFNQPQAWRLWLQVLGDCMHATNISLVARLASNSPRVETSTQTFGDEVSVVASNIPELIDSKSKDSGKTVLQIITPMQPPSIYELPLTESSPQDIEAVLTIDTTVNDQARRTGSAAPLNYRYIQQAGFLYLLNWLRDYPALINLPMPLSPWLWLVYLYAECCAAWQLPQDKALQQLLLDIGGLDEADFHAGEKLFSTEAMRSARLYLQKRLEKFQLDNYTWIQVPARVMVEQGYIQLYIHEACISVALRLAGLDFNPGWVPSLGRVIQFHFGSYPELHSFAVHSPERQSSHAAEGGLCDE